MALTAPLLCSSMLNFAHANMEEIWADACYVGGYRLRNAAKRLLLLFSLLAVICEEVVENPLRCGGLYFFEFTSCSALLLSLLALCLYCTAAYERFGKENVERVNFYAMPCIGGIFLLASVVFAATSSGSHLENAACAFGFLASIAFLAEGVMNYLDKRKQATESRSENPAHIQTVTESQPLNK
ncbi:PREDICTED: CKLF-like MARVEL transmembrane domain-containing protein 6 [Tinamus guttatus]|uniref:CKLF-like MARVEL transmembrane domain-containing protein 6 n=1 Tax=Tinamus guttatus TaxID=94827 RepID=UPI00052EF7A0|nr:PREDICTED: CKLF-like MARVEL transmembrane domain-containing protein 6 [Tinamus guttatus]